MFFREGDLFYVNGQSSPGKVTVMFAIMKTGGKQYRVMPGQSVLVEKLEQESGSEVIFSDVLCVGAGEKVQLGTPSVAHACVKATLVRHVRGEKIIIFKKNRRHNYRRKNGHRQPLTLVKILEVVAGGALSPAQGEA